MTDSLRRLGTDRIDLYQLHLADLPVPRAQALVGTCEDLVAEGLIRAYGWSTDRADRAAAFGQAAAGATAVQHALSVLRDAPGCSPSATSTTWPASTGARWGWGCSPASTRRVDAAPRRRTRAAPRAGWSGSGAAGPPRSGCAGSARSVRALTADGRTLAQGALGWIWARSGRTVPIPGCRTVAQVEENAAALRRGPLAADQFAEVERQLAAVRTAALRDADRPHWPRSRPSRSSAPEPAPPRPVRPRPVLALDGAGAWPVRVWFRGAALGVGGCRDVDMPAAHDPRPAAAPGDAPQGR